MIEPEVTPRQRADIGSERDANKLGTALKCGWPQTGAPLSSSLVEADNNGAVVAGSADGGSCQVDKVRGSSDSGGNCGKSGNDNAISSANTGGGELADDARQGLELQQQRQQQQWDAGCQIGSSVGGGSGDDQQGPSALIGDDKKKLSCGQRQMRSSCIESVPDALPRAPSEHRRMQDGSCGLSAGDVGGGEASATECCSLSSDLNCRSIKSTRGAITVGGSDDSGGGGNNRHQQQRELEVEWTRRKGLFKRVAPFSGHSGSLCIRTSLVRTIKGKKLPQDTIGRTIKSLVGNFRSNLNDSGSGRQQSKKVSDCRGSSRERGASSGEKGGSSGGGETSRQVEDNCARSATRLEADLELEVVGEKKCSAQATRDHRINSSVSCQSVPIASDLEAEEQSENGARYNYINNNAAAAAVTKNREERQGDEDEAALCRGRGLVGEIVGKSSNIISLSSTAIGNMANNMAASGGDGGFVAKNKYMVDDAKLRKQQQQQQQQQRQQQTSKWSSAKLEDRRSTYCSSIGAVTTDMNYDSSFSSGNNFSESNNTCAIRQCSRERGSSDPHGGSKEEESNDRCNRPSSNRSPNAVSPPGCCERNNRNKNKRPPNEDGGEGGGGGGSGGGGATAAGGLQKPRENWDKNIEFLLAVIGFAVDLGNIWRFPYICYTNGGGAFLIPYTIMFILGGLPIFYLEMSLGQYFSSGCLTVWKRVCPMAKGIGYAMCVLNFFTGLYYNTIISWAVFFFVESFTDVLPWTSCNNSWNSPECKTIEQRQSGSLVGSRLNSSYPYESATDHNQSVALFSRPTKDYFEREVLQVHKSTGIDSLGSIRYPLAIYLAIVFICIYFAIWKGVKSTGKAVWITALLPYFVLIPLLIRGVFLEGAWLGIKYYLYPQWMKIFEPTVWVEAAKQIYFSLGPGFGTLMALSSYNKFTHNCRRDALIAASVNYFASFISGLVIFAVLGYMATIENISINDVATEGPGLVFQVYPEGLATMRFSSMWSVLFFMMVITLGIDSTFGGLESVITGLCDEYPRVLGARRGVFIGFLIVLIYLCSLPTTTYGGNYVINLLESYGTSLSLLFIVLIETVIVCWLYGADRFCRNLEEMYGEMPGPYWRICWKYISPTILLLIFLAACGQELDKYHTLTIGDYSYPSWAPTLGLLMTGSSVCCIPIYAIYYLKTKTSGTFLERIKTACRPIEGDQRVEKEIYLESLADKIKDENDTIHLDTVI